MVWSGDTRAQTAAYYPGSADVRLGVVASVTGHCGFSDDGVPNGSFSQPGFDSTGFVHDFEFRLVCSTPVRVAVVSANGGLRTQGSAPQGYANVAPYDVTLNLVGDGSTVAHATCPASTLVEGATCSFRGPASAAQGLRLPSAAAGQTGSYVRVNAALAPATPQLVPGSYTDTLLITLSASP